MKKLKFKFCILLIVVFSFSSISILYGCSSKKSTDSSDKTQQDYQTTSASTTSASSNTKKTDLTSLYDQVKNLKGQDALNFFQSLSSKGLSDSEILDFFINLPLSDANKEVDQIYKDENFETYMSTYPSGNVIKLRIHKMVNNIFKINQKTLDFLKIPQ